MADANATQAITPLDAGLKNLKETIDEKAPSDDFRTIVHYEVHPNIKEAFNLQVIPEFPLPILTFILGISGIVLYSRIETSGRFI